MDRDPVTDDGDNRFVACYRDLKPLRLAPTQAGVPPNAPPTARGPRSATAPDTTTRAARSTFAEYVETVWLPAEHVQTTILAYRS